MPYTVLHPVKQLDFQINRILTYGDAACNFDEVCQTARQITDLETWYMAWRAAGQRAESEARFLHAAYYYRLAEFFLSESLEKTEMYEKSIQNFRASIDADESVRTEYVPYQNVAMKTLVFKAEQAVGSLVVFGGYDSFIEEFYLAIKEWVGLGYTIYLFEGPGQGETRKQGLPFEPYWEKPVGAVLDYFGLQNVGVIGISWGGYLALRTAAFDKRILKVAAYDVLYDGFDCMTNAFPKPVRWLVNGMFAIRAKALFNCMVRALAKKKLIVRWAVLHGQYITGTTNPYDFYLHLKRHTLKGIMGNIQCDVLLLAGECDHYIPADHFCRIWEGLTNARSRTGRIFTQAEGGAEHCQVGNHQLASDCIMAWISGEESMA